MFCFVKEELGSDEIGNLAGEISQKSVQGTAIFLLTTYRKM